MYSLLDGCLFGKFHWNLVHFHIVSLYCRLLHSQKAAELAKHPHNFNYEHGYRLSKAWLHLFSPQATDTISAIPKHQLTSSPIHVKFSSPPFLPPGPQISFLLLLKAPKLHSLLFLHWTLKRAASASHLLWNSWSKKHIHSFPCNCWKSLDSFHHHLSSLHVLFLNKNQ